MASSRVSRSLVVLLCCAWTFACEQKQELPASSEAVALARAYFPELASRRGTSKVFSASEVPLTPQDDRALTSRLVGAGALELTTRGMTFRVEQTLGADDSAVLSREEAVAFSGARHFWFPVGDFASLSQGWRGSRIEEAWVVDGSEPLHRAEYHVTLPPWVSRLHDAGEYVEFLDTEGQPVLRFHPSEVRDAKGQSRRGRVLLSGVSRSSRANVFDASGPRVSLVTEVSLEGLAAPMVVDPGWSSTASMATARSQHAALLQADGSVLVAGGVNNLGFVTTAERFDVERGTWASAGSPGIQGNITMGVRLPSGRSLFLMDGSLTGVLHDAATNTWSATGPASASRSVGTATLLASGEVLVAGGSNLATSEIYDPVANSFTAAGNLSVVHRGHVSVLLRDGRVLLVSGTNGSSTELPQVELFDPAARTWTQVAPLLVPRHYATGTLLPDGRVLLAGGYTGSNAVSTHAEIYDPAANTWTATGALNHRRNGHTATLLPSGKVLVSGGVDEGRNPQPISELYDPATGTWSPAGTMAVGRENSTATLLTTGQVLVTGGHSSPGGTTFYAGVDVYEASSDRWSPAGNLSRVRGYAASVLLPSGDVLLVGGSDAAGAVATVERYSRASNAWAPSASLATARARPTASLLPSGRVLAAGGEGGGAPLASVEEYDATANAWSTVGAMTAARVGHTATVLGSGRVFVVGGSGTNVAEVYDPAARTWSAVAAAPTVRLEHAAVLLNDGRILVAGGRNPGGLLASAELYDPVANTWAPAASLAQGRATFTMTLLPSGRVLATAGMSGAGELASAELYDPVSNTWTAAGNLATARVFHSAVLLPSGRVLVAGGEGSPGVSLASAELYDTTTRTWKVVTALAAARARFALDVLPSGEVLAAGGEGSGGAWLASAELFEDTGSPPATRPVVTGPDTASQGCPVRITGTQFRGASGGSSGDYRDSAANLPVVRVRTVEGDRLWALPGTEMTATGVTVTIPATMPVGTQVVSVFANAVSGGRVLTVIANTAPVARDLSVSTGFGAPVNITLEATDAEAGAPLGYVIVTPPTHGTLSGTPPAVTYTPNAGYSGPDSFTYRARDCGLDSNVSTVSINVAATNPPTITCPADLQVEATGASGATVTYPPATATDDTTANPTVTYSHPSGSTLPLGETVITATAEDADGAQASCTFRVTVRDTTPPTLVCPENVRVVGDDGGGALVTYTVPASVDGISGPATVTATPASGTRFPSGRTRVVVTATDAAGNSASCEFEVLVQARVVSIAGGGCQSAGGGGLGWGAAWVLAAWASRRRGKERRPVRSRVRMGALAVALVSTSAVGQTVSSPLVAFDAERLRLSASATDSLMVDTGRVLTEGGYRLSLLAGYERGILILEGNDGSSRSILHYRTSAWLQGAWSPVDRLEVSARLPVIISQGGHGAGLYEGVSEPSSSGLGTPEVGARYALMRREDGAPLSLAVGLDVGLPGGRASAFGRQEHWAGMQFSPRVSLGREVGMFALGASVGARVRSKEVEPGRDVGTELEQSVVVATRGKGLRGELALQVAESLVHPDVAVELLGGVRLPIGSGFEVNALAGHGFTDIPGTPSWRVGAGIAWAHEPEQKPDSDSDGDSVPDKKDRCPREAGVPENDGCPDRDSDGDGVVDRLDRCPDEAGIAESQGCPEPDEDGDGVPDAKDKCPKEKGTAENQGCPAVKDTDGDGVPDDEDKCPSEKGTAENQGCPAVKDTDGDGVPDGEDKCPSEKGTAENQGCPAPVKKPVQEEKLSLSGRRVTFPVGLAVIEGEGARVLDEVVEMLKSRPDVAIRVEGHTDNTGPETLNQELSQSRAEAVRSYLIQRGINGSRLEARGYGPSRPVASNDTPEGRSANRRVDFVIKN
ncbi:kelch domain-containing protein [Myxococcus stipitatus DSM 14675]|uniref:Kelch domain-containing protein n=1 Tax=Myxococcus stipitatus (strain DSM 14675 / JCM 12634 / Mx s8) TaxID=1278073 RepID=L7U9I3_MYXSD|nr:kelch repeat-containing protein [Myxococcus stipitatus]AGC43124.1 kelch domain-containing protein [Myxococcus stipitatus DSM 14675]